MAEKLTVPVCFLVTPCMHEGIRKASEKRDVKISQLLRWLTREFLKTEKMEIEVKADIGGTER
jgi:hypothetical protein